MGMWKLGGYGLRIRGQWLYERLNDRLNDVKSQRDQVTSESNLCSNNSVRKSYIFLHEVTLTLASEFDLKSSDHGETAR